MEYYLIIRNKFLYAHDRVDLKYTQANKVHRPEGLHSVILHVHDPPKKEKNMETDKRSVIARE